ncbi:TlpA disulfide reductase family protein [Bacteriovorax sp. DB6_IX]|uniref:TlpA family protein disulfide reductase n=1 Tax=Bacteriovorax sp. DB6_IX TaxID=1353530 RepID=UPI00038A22C8|nr:TlpA disulfide reductase family protein [Bacteriovorax sp. DB6_IX]EQC51293.1 redoxin [Bacteriovorax sp. DB6_IX]
MKKILPFKYIILVAIIIVTALVVPENGYLSAKKSDEVNKKHQHYEAILKSMDVKSLAGKSFDKKNLLSDVVILNFWASWCKPCLEEFPSLVSLRKNYPTEKLKIIGINSDEDNVLKNIKKIQKKYNLNFDVVVDKNGSLTDKFMISAIPVSIIFHNGKVIEVSQGAKDFDSEEFKEKIEPIIK